MVMRQVSPNKPVSPAVDIFHDFGHFGPPPLPPRAPRARREAGFDRPRLEIGANDAPFNFASIGAIGEL